MNILTVCSLVVIGCVITNTTASRLPDRESSSCDCDYMVDELQQQQEQQQKQLQQQRELIQQLQDHEKETQQHLQTFREQIQKLLQYKLLDVVEMIPNPKDQNTELKSHKISKRETPLRGEESIDFDQFLSQLRIFGVTGDPGRDGIDGKDGVNGRDGVTGAPGRDGRDGLAGENGREGIDGKDGVNGRDGVTGAPGREGIYGKDGVNGRDGVTGAPGKDGRDGLDGEDCRYAVDGKDGVDGIDGRDGAPGSPGAAGPKGAPGYEGAVGPRGVPGENSATDAGAVYTRWGRTNCGSHSTLVYEGFASSSPWNTTGGGTNYQCLPLDPQYNSFSRSFPHWHQAQMAGTEYQSASYGIFPNSAHNQNVPCARCYTESRTAVMMIPAKKTCPDEWTREYTGYLMTGNIVHVHQATFECVDGHPEYIPGLGGNTNGALFLFIRVYCSGSHTTGHCPPYYKDREMTCVVCTK